DFRVTGVQTCALPVWTAPAVTGVPRMGRRSMEGRGGGRRCGRRGMVGWASAPLPEGHTRPPEPAANAAQQRALHDDERRETHAEIGRASCRGGIACGR